MSEHPLNFDRFVFHKVGINCGDTERGDRVALVPQIRTILTYQRGIYKLADLNDRIVTRCNSIQPGTLKRLQG